MVRVIACIIVGAFAAVAICGVLFAFVVYPIIMATRGDWGGVSVIVVALTVSFLFLWATNRLGWW